FNGTAILTSAATQTFQIGANVTANDVIDVVGVDMSSSGTALASAITAGVSLSSTSAAIGSAIQAIDSAINEINAKRADFGAIQNRFDSVISNLQVSVENQTAARSRIMDADFAAETAN